MILSDPFLGGESDEDRNVNTANKYIRIFDLISKVV